MADKTLLAISSDVGIGGVGLSIMRYVFASRGIQQICLPTVILASRPDLGRTARHIIEAIALGDFFQALCDDGWFPKIDAVITGYFSERDQVVKVGRAIADLKKANPNLIYVLDPVFGDEGPGLYVDASVATAILEHLMPLADVMTPNKFEFNWICERKRISSVRALSGEIAPPSGSVIVTSAAVDLTVDPAQISTVILEHGNAHEISSRYFDEVPKGTGDIFAAEITCSLAMGCELTQAVERAVELLEKLAERAQNLSTFEPYLILYPNN